MLNKQMVSKTPLRGVGGLRIQSFDLARGFTVLIMPSIHVVMLYSIPAVQQSILGDILAFIAEGPGAQLFMLLMGVSFTFSSRITKRQVFKRAFLLLVAAYALNFFKFIVPLGLGVMPANLLAELNLNDNYTSVPFFLLLGDILHFAAMAYIILYLVYRLPGNYYWSLFIAIAVIVSSPFVWDLHTGFAIPDYLMTLLGGHPPYAFFPLFPWLVYPMVGLTLGALLKASNQIMIIKKAGAAGIGLVIIACLFPATKQNIQWLPFYRTAPADTIFHLGFVLAWLFLFYWLHRKLRSNYFFNLLTFCSKNITVIYLIQWVLICWGMGITGYARLGFQSTLISMATVTLITLLLTHFLNNAKPKDI